jgi:hypothetical protein
MANTNKQKLECTTAPLIETSRMTSTNGYLSLAADGCPTLKIPVDSATMASALLSRYRDHFGIGASDMKEGCGDIRADDGTLVARVSYNGRVWTPGGRLLQEPGWEA